MMTITQKPLVSVIVPVYNVEDYLDACLDSIKQQTYEHLEILIIEDCSTDTSNQLLQAHIEDERVQIIQHANNSGLSVARNTGMQAATGEYMMFVDSDDIIDLDLVQTGLHCALASDADVVLLNVKPFQDGEPIQNSSMQLSEHHNYESITQVDYFEYPHFAWLKFMRSDLVRSQNLQFPIDQYYEDWPFHWKVGFVTSKIVKAGEGYYHYRQRGDSITGSGDHKLLHIFSSDQMIGTLVDKYAKSPQINSIMADRIYSGIWFVLTTIDKRYLKEAILAAKQHLQATHKYRKFGSPTIKIRLLLINLKLPTPFARLAITNLRVALNNLSSARRQVKR